MLTVFNDAKRGTLSAWSWPSREVAFQRGKQFLEKQQFRSSVKILKASGIYFLQVMGKC